MRTGSRLNNVTIGILVLLLCAGCASLAERGLLPEIKARQVPDVILGQAIVLLENVEIAEGSDFKSLITSDGRAHLFVSDRKERIHHVEIVGNNVLSHEILGDTSNHRQIDAVEYPAGTLRVLAGDKQFIRASSEMKWQEVKGNRCSRFIQVDDDLLCAFVAEGKEIKAPMRRDYTVGWFILIPVVFWSDVYVDKLVIAQETPNGWAVRAVFDPETNLSAESDFMVGTGHDGFMHFLYRTSGGSHGFMILLTPAGGGAWSDVLSGTEIRYARVKYDEVVSGITNVASQGAGKENGDSPSPLPGIQGKPLSPVPDIEAKSGAYGLSRSLDRHFALNGVSGEIGGLIRVDKQKPDDEFSDERWINVTLNDGVWDPHLDIVTAKDLPDSGDQWLIDFGSLIAIDSAGHQHVLLVKSIPGFWNGTIDMCYLLKADKDWSAPLIIGNNVAIDSRRSLSVDGNGNVFAAWVNQDDKIVGKWIWPKKLF